MQLKEHNIQSDKYHRSNRSAAMLASFKHQEATPRLRRAHLRYDGLLKENRKLITLFWMLIEERDILVNFLYKAYCRHLTVDFLYLCDFSGGLLRRLHKR